MAYETREERIAALSRVKMPNGMGGRPPNGKTGSMCVMECVAWVDGTGPLTDAPACASPVLRRLAVRLNDGPWWESDKERTAMLLPLVVLLAGSRDDARELSRIKAVHAWAVALRYETALVRAETAAKKLEAKWPEHAEKIRAAAEVLRAERTADNARALRRVAYAAAYAAADAAANAAAYAADAADAAVTYAAAYAADAADAAAAYAAADALRAARVKRRDSLLALLTSLLS